MDAKEILNPKWLLIGVGSLMFLASLSGVMDGQSWAESGWGKENVAEHDAEYEQMWALHVMPLAAMSIATGLIVSGRALAQMAMAAAVSGSAPAATALSMPRFRSIGFAPAARLR